MKGHKTAIGIGIASLWVMNICVNILMGPARAIINDLVETSYLVTANSIATACMGTLIQTSPKTGPNETQPFDPAPYGTYTDLPLISPSFSVFWLSYVRYYRKSDRCLAQRHGNELVPTQSCFDAFLDRFALHGPLLGGNGSRGS